MNPNEIATKEDIRKLEQRILRTITQLDAERGSRYYKEWMSREEASEYTGFSKSKLIDLEEREELVPSRCGRRVIYSRKEIDAYLNSLRYVG